MNGKQKTLQQIANTLAFASGCIDYVLFVLAELGIQPDLKEAFKLHDERLTPGFHDKIPNDDNHLTFYHDNIALIKNESRKGAEESDRRIAKNRRWRYLGRSR